MYRIFDDSGFHSDETFESIKEATGFIDDVLAPDQITYFVTDTSTGITAVIVHDSKVWKPVDAAAPGLLAVAEKLIQFQRNFEIKSMGNKMPGNDLYSGLLMDIVNETEVAIAAAKGESS